MCIVRSGAATQTRPRRLPSEVAIVRVVEYFEVTIMWVAVSSVSNIRLTISSVTGCGGVAGIALGIAIVELATGAGSELRIER